MLFVEVASHPLKEFVAALAITLVDLVCLFQRPLQPFYRPPLPYQGKADLDDGRVLFQIIRQSFVLW